MRRRMKMNDKELILKILGHNVLSKAYVKDTFFKRRKELGKMGKSPPIFYSPLKQLVEDGLVIETKDIMSGGKLLSSYDKNGTIRKPVKTQLINNETFFQPSDLENQLALMRTEVGRLRRKMAKDRMVLENYIMYLQEQIKDMKDLEIQRLNMEQNRNKMRETNE